MAWGLCIAVLRQVLCSSPTALLCKGAGPAAYMTREGFSAEVGKVVAEKAGFPSRIIGLDIRVCFVMLLQPFLLNFTTPLFLLESVTARLQKLPAYIGRRIALLRSPSSEVTEWNLWGSSSFVSACCKGASIPPVWLLQPSPVVKFSGPSLSGSSVALGEWFAPLRF